MQAVRYMMAKPGFQNVIGYVDDFLAIGATRAECTRAYKVLLQLLQDYGHLHTPSLERLNKWSQPLKLIPTGGT